MRPARLFTLFYWALPGMELSYLYLLVSLLNGPIYSLILVLLLYPLALLSRLALSRSALPQRLWSIMEVAGVTLVMLLVTGERLLTSLATGPADVFGVVVVMGFCALAWWLGHTVPHEEVSYSRVALRLQMGILALLLFSQVGGSAPLVFLFFLLAALALFLARWASSLSHGAAPLHTPHPGHLLLAGGSVIVPGLALVLLLSPDVGRTIVNWLGDILRKFSEWTAAPQNQAPNPPFEFNFNLSCGRSPEEAVPPAPPPPADGGAGISPVIIWLIVLALFLAILAVIVFALRRLSARRKVRPVAPVRFQVRMVSGGMLRRLIARFPELLKELWSWLVSLFLRWQKRPQPSEEASVSIRAVYRNLLRWAARQGVARAPAQTPLEHLALLEQKFPQQQPDLQQITGAYLLARYGQKPVSDAELDSVKRAWQRAMAHHIRSRVGV